MQSVSEEWAKETAKKINEQQKQSQSKATNKELHAKDEGTEGEREKERKPLKVTSITAQQDCIVQLKMSIVVDVAAFDFILRVRLLSLKGSAPLLYTMYSHAKRIFSKSMMWSIVSVTRFISKMSLC